MEQFPSLPSARLDSFMQSELSASPPTFMSDFADATHNLLMDETPSRRAAAATKLAELGRPAATPYLVAALTDRAIEVRLAAAASLGQIGDAASVSSLQEMLVREKDNDTALQIVSQAIRSIATRAGVLPAPSTQAAAPVAERDNRSRVADSEHQRLTAIEAN